jgi:FAD/FMN-containing dehydrogenase
MAQDSPDWQALAADVAGEVLAPDAPGYETARRPALARFRDVRPAAVVRCARPADVAALIAFARAAGLPVAARSGGHCFAGHSSTEGVVADVGPMAEVTVADGVATVGAGARLGAVYDALDAEGLTIPAGCGPRVGTAGLVLGGGLGILGRMRGVLADSLVGADAVLADGRVVACDEDHETDLFWALRGAGAGGFAIVTALRFATLPAPDATRLLYRWPAPPAGAVLEAWQGWAPVAPDPLAASLLVAAPADPALAPVVTVAGAYAGPREEAAALLDDLVARVGTPPGETLLEHASYRATKRALSNDGAEDPLEREHIAHRSAFFGAPIPPDATAALLAHLEADRRPGEGRELDFGPLGGAYARVPADATAFVHRDAAFLLKASAAVAAGADARAKAAAQAWADRALEIVAPHGTGGAYQNFPEPGRADWARAYHGANLERLVAIRGRYDPENALRGPQTIPLPARSAG